jgi:hypothetical protein
MQGDGQKNKLGRRIPSLEKASPNTATGEVPKP